MAIITKRRFSLLILAVLLFAAAVTSATASQAAGIIHVDASVSGGNNDGTSWADAYDDLQRALSSASAGDEIWVANGVYTPGATANATFQLLSNVTIYGGFEGAETRRDERDWKANLTILSGDIDGNDITDSATGGNPMDSPGLLTSTANIVGTNSYHVVTGNGVAATAVLDGFTITAGQAMAINPHDRGGGMLNIGGSPTLTNLTFLANAAKGGGGIYNNNESNPTFTNVFFVANSATFDGGGIFNNNQSNPTFTNVSFVANTVNETNAGGGGMFNFNSSNPMLINVTFSANSAKGTNGRGGAMLNAISNPTIVNSIVWNNSASIGANIQNNSSSPQIRYSLIQGSGGSGNWSSTFGTDSGSNIDGDPLFVTAIDANEASPSVANFQLRSGSPAIDTGNSLSYISSVTTDLVGNARIQNRIIDMGAYESTAASPNIGSSIYLSAFFGRLDSENDVPTRTETTSPTETPMPTRTAGPIETATPTETASPTATTPPTETPDPMGTPAATETPPTNSELQPGTNQISIEQTIEGVTVSRTVYIQAPDSLASGQSYPVVFAFHGAGGSGAGFTNSTHLNQLINAGNFIGVYPNGHSNDGGDGGFWNLGTEPTTADDVEFVNLIVQRLSSYSQLDTTTMYGIGTSNGAGMINRLGKLTTHFRAIAPIVSQQSTTTGALTPAAAVSVFQLNGDADTLIPIDGGSSPVGEFLSAEESALNWVSHFNCAVSPVEDEVVWGATTLASFTYSNCESGHEVRYYIAFGMGHGGFQDEAASQLFTEIWAFFQQH